MERIGSLRVLGGWDFVIFLEELEGEDIRVVKVRVGGVSGGVSVKEREEIECLESVEFAGRLFERIESEKRVKRTRKCFI